MSMFDLSGKVSMVSGAASGMGQAMALGLAEAGSDLLIVDRNAEGMQKTADEIAAMGRKVVQVVCDVSNIEQIRGELFGTLDKEFGQINFLGNVAGDGHLAHPEDLEIEDLHRVLQNLVVGRFCCAQEAGRRMLKAGNGGSIINIGSLASISSLGRGHIAYSISMGAVVQMTRELSTEWSGRGIRVNAILPAQVTNDSLRKRMAADPNLEARFLSGIPAGRMGMPSDIKGLAVLLASDASSWITGACIPMDGGNLAMNAGGTPGVGDFTPWNGDK